MGNLGSGSNAYKVSVNSASQEVSHDGRTSAESDPDSIEQILKDSAQHGSGGNKGIVVSRQINIARS